MTDSSGNDVKKKHNRGIVEEVKKSERNNYLKKNFYYTIRGLTKAEQTGELLGPTSTNVSTNELYKRESSTSQSTRRYKQLQEQNQETKKDEQKEFKDKYKVQQDEKETDKTYEEEQDEQIEER